jgi:predicted transposase YbfD/YdcC
VVIGLCAVICGAEGWEDIEEFGRRRERWLRDVLGLELPNGIPGHDTIRRVYNRLDPNELNKRICDWLGSLRRGELEEIIALDGKTARHSYDTRTGQSAIHLVSAWATESGLSLGQVKVDKKSNEITALPQLLKLLDVAGCTVTIDAMGCQKNLARQIRDQQGHYVLALKENQEGLYDAVELLFNDGFRHDWYKNDPRRRIEYDHYQTIEKDHGRLETRDYWVITGRHVSELTQAPEWEGLTSVVLAQSKRVIGDTVSIQRRYFITSHEGKATKIARAVREHWRVENGLHYVLDVAMDEDACGIWKDNGPENLATLRRAAVSLLRQEHSSRRGVKARMKIAAMDTDFLLRVLSV